MAALARWASSELVEESFSKKIKDMTDMLKKMIHYFEQLI